MSVRFEEAGEVGGEKEEEGNVGEEEEEEKEEDNVGEVGEARWGMSFLSLHLLLRLHHSRSTKLFGTLLTLSSWRTVSQLLALHIFYSLHNLGSYWHCPVSNVPIAETQKAKKDGVKEGLLVVGVRLKRHIDLAQIKHDVNNKD